MPSGGKVERQGVLAQVNIDIKPSELGTAPFQGIEGGDNHLLAILVRFSNCTQTRRGFGARKEAIEFRSKHSL